MTKKLASSNQHYIAIVVLAFYLILGPLPLCGGAWLVAEAQAADFLGAEVMDREVPSSAMRVGVVGVHPLVGEVRNGSTAERCGLRRGDVILKSSNVPVAQTKNIIDNSGDIRNLTVLRNSQRLTLLCAASADTITSEKANGGHDGARGSAEVTPPVTAKRKASDRSQAVDKQKLQNYLLNGRFDLLEKEFSNLLEGCKKGEHDDRILDQAFSAFSSTDPRFEALLTSWIEKYPSSAIAATARGYHYVKLGGTSRGTAYASDTPKEKFTSMETYFLKAAADLTEACGRDSGLSVAYAKFLVISKSVGNTEVSGALLSKALLHNPNSYAIRASYLDSLQPKWGGSLDQIKGFLVSLEHDSKNRPWLSPLLGYLDYVSADTLTRDKRYEEALAYYTRAIDAGLPEYVARGRIYNVLGREKEAMADFNYVLASDPQNGEALEARGAALSERKKHDLAIADLNAAIKMDPLFPPLLLYRAYSLQCLQRHEEALTDLEASLEYDVYNPYTFQQMGIIKKNIYKSFEAAKLDLKRAIELKPDDPLSLYEYLAVLYELKDCGFEKPFHAYKQACTTSQSKYCSNDRKAWANRYYSYAKNDHEYGCR